MERGALLLLKFEVVGKEGARSYLTLKRFQLNGGPVKHAEAELVVEAATAAIPRQFALGQNYPNLFNPSTNINYQLPKAERVRITIYDLAGRQVRELLNENKEAGSYTVQWNGKNQLSQTVATGVYIYKIQAGQFSQTRKMLFLK